MSNKIEYFQNPYCKQTYIYKNKNINSLPLHFFCLGRAEKRDPNHPDYVPSVFTFKPPDQTPDKLEKKIEKHNRVKKRTKTVEERCNKNLVKKNKKYDYPSSDGENSLPSTSYDNMMSGPLIMSLPSTYTPISPVKPIQLLSPTPQSVNLPHTPTNPLLMSPPTYMPPLSSRVCTTPLPPNAESLLDIYRKEIISLKKERDEAREQVEQIKSKFLCYTTLKKKPNKFKYYTGIQRDTFSALFKYLKKGLPRLTRTNAMSYEDQLLMVLIKLRLNIQFENLSDQFNCPKSSIHDIFKRWINLMYTKMKNLIKWPDHDASFRTLPHTFRQYFPRLTAIIDCTEIFIQRPKTLKARAQVYSNYKKHSTVKYLIACTPHGSISFLSQAYGGRASDIEIVKESGMISPKLHFPGDQILADRGFTLNEEFAAGCGVQLIIPSFTKGKKQLSAEEVETSRQIAAIRIHIERVIGLVKSRYKILDGTLSIPLVKSLSDEVSESVVANVDKLVTVCAALVNCGDGIVYSEKGDK